MSIQTHTTTSNHFLNVSTSHLISAQSLCSAYYDDQADYRFTNYTVPQLSIISDTTNCSGDFFFINGTNRTVSGTYYDYYTAANECDSIIEATLIVETCGSGQAPDNEDVFQVYPNPVKDVLTIEGSKIGIYEVIDLLGNKVSQGTTNRINFSEMNEGLYYLKLTLENRDRVLMKIYHY